LFGPGVVAVGGFADVEGGLAVAAEGGFVAGEGGQVGAGDVDVGEDETISRVGGVLLGFVQAAEGLGDEDRAVWRIMPGQSDESRAIFGWLAESVSPDTFVNIMGQYRPAYQVGTDAGEEDDAGAVRYAEINRRPAQSELDAAYQAARDAGLWRFDA